MPRGNPIAILRIQRKILRELIKMSAENHNSAHSAQGPFQVTFAALFRKFSLFPDNTTPSASVLNPTLDEASAVPVTANPNAEEDIFIPDAKLEPSSRLDFLKKAYSWYWPTNSQQSKVAEESLLHYIPFFVPNHSHSEKSSKKECKFKNRANKNDSVTEEKMLDIIDDSDDISILREKYIAKIGHVAIGDGRLINTLVMKPRTDHNLEVDESNTSHTKRNVVMTHGYGAGLGFFYKNYTPLAMDLLPRNYTIYSVDWLGMGRSSRPPFPSRKRNVTPAEYVEEVENFFVDSLEEWRKQCGVEKMILMGHSMGGYLSAAYSLKYPERVEKLLLVSPAGVPKQPEPELDPTKRYMPGWAATLWDMNFTPMSIIRMLGPWGPDLVSRYTDRRFNHLTPNEIASLKDYIYHINSASASGELALASLLAPGAWARKPLVERVKELKMPTAFLYGDIDWMDYRHGQVATKHMTVPSNVWVVEKAGHHLYLDNPEVFNKTMLHVILDWVNA